MDFAGRPGFAFAVHALLEPVPGGAYRGVALDGSPVAFDAQRMASALEVSVDASGRGVFAVIAGPPARFAADWKAGLVTAETADGPRRFEADAFRHGAVRTGPDGRAICSLLSPLHEQYSLCRDTRGAEAHCLDVADLADSVRDAESAAALRDSGLYDIVASGMDDGSGFADLMARLTRKETPVHVSAGLDRVLPGEWAQLRDFPQFMMASVRAVFGSYMDELLDGQPMEDVSRLHAAPGTPLAMALEEVAELVSTDAPFEGGNVLKGYRTSPVARFEGDGFAAVVFSDPAGTYAYAWKRNAEPRPEPGP